MNWRAVFLLAALSGVLLGILNGFIFLPSHALAEAPPPRIRMLAEVKRVPADLKRRPDGLEEIEALRRGLSVPAWPTALAIHPDGSRIALADNSGRVDLWKWRENQHIPIRIAGGYFPRIEFSRDGRTLLTADGEHGFLVRAWDSQTGAVQSTIGKDPSTTFEPVGAPRFWQASDHLVAFLPAELSELMAERLIAGKWSQRLPSTGILHIVRDGRAVRSWSAPGPFCALLVDTERRWVAMMRDERKQPFLMELRWDSMAGCGFAQKATIEIYDLDSGRKLTSLHPSGRNVIFWYPAADGKLLMTTRHTTVRKKDGSWGAASEIWDLATGRKLAGVNGRPAQQEIGMLLPPAPATQSGDGRWILFETDSGHVVWDTTTRKLVPGLRMGGPVEFVPGTSLLLLITPEEKQLRMELLDLESRRRVSLKERLSAYPRYMVSPYPRYMAPRVAASSRAGLLAIWNFTYATSGTGGYHIYGPEGDSEIRLWNVRTGELWGTLGGHQAPVRFVEFSADGRLVATVDAEANLRLGSVQAATE